MVLVMGAAGSAGAQNLLTNPNFDTDLSEWHLYPSYNDECTWYPATVSNPGSSGCASCFAPSFTMPLTRSHTGLYQCASVEVGDRIFAESYHQVPCSQSGAGVVRVSIQYFDEMNHTVQPGSDCVADGDDCAVWNRSRCDDEYVTAEWDMNTTMVRACVMMRVTNTIPSGQFWAAFDEAKLMPVMIFSDDFEETADTSMWSATVP